MARLCFKGRNILWLVDGRGSSRLLFASAVQRSWSASGTKSNTSQNTVFAMGWSRLSNNWKTRPRLLSSNRGIFRKKEPYVKVEAKRSFLKYAFVWTGARMEGFLVRVADVNLCAVYAQERETEWFTEEMIMQHANELGAAVSLEQYELFDALQSIWDVHSKSEFDERLILHLLHLEEWRKTVRSAKEAESEIEDAGATFSLLEVAEDGTRLRRNTFCDLNVVAVRPFDFRTVGGEEKIGRATTEAEEGIEISCAAMIVLMQIVDGVGDEYAICSICNQLSTGARRILQLRGEIMRIYSKLVEGRNSQLSDHVVH